MATQLTTVQVKAAAISLPKQGNEAAVTMQRQVQQKQQVAANANSSSGNNNKNLTQIMKKLQDDFSKYKYTVYRCASKFIALQKIFHTSKIPYKLILAILDRHGMSATTASMNLNLMVPPFQLTSLIHDIYFACEKLGHFSKNSSYQLERNTQLLANFFWNIYDPQRRHSISLLEIKITFLLLCKVYISDLLIADFFALLADAKTQNQVSRYAFELMLATLSKLLSYVGESKAYGSHNLNEMMEQCFMHRNSGLTEQQFHHIWTQRQTRFLIYANLLALIKRMEDTEHLIHTNSCYGCRKEHIIGIRFKCQVCRDVSLCLTCFATGHGTGGSSSSGGNNPSTNGGKHEASHRMCEVFMEDPVPVRQKWRDYLACLCMWGWFQKSQQQRRAAKDEEEEERRGFCNSPQVHGTTGNQELAAIPAQMRSMEEKPPAVVKKQEDIQELCSLAGLATNASERMQSIIDRLILQNAKLETQLQLLSSTSSAQISDFLSSHQKFLLQIIEDMRQLSVSSASPKATNPLVSSTFVNASTPQRQIFDMYAPVGANLTHSINGADLNRTYLEANKSDYSLNDVSLWFDQRRSSLQNAQGSTPLSLPCMPPLNALLEHPVVHGGDGRDTEMINFKLLLNKVKEIVEDSYSDNAELSAATQNLENVLDNIIQSEEQQRQQNQG
ncbi:dystrotelin [Drosophila tropicalis]|uniref:dystrotelin n=1 Tax=Drosophila tropicalis TaxID=46794 RepID=UPI0035AB94BC